MFVMLFDPAHAGKRLGKVGLTKNARGLGGNVGTRLGQAGLRFRSDQGAAQTRQNFENVIRFVNVTGFQAHILTTSAEDKALFRSRHIDTTSQNHWVK